MFKILLPTSLLLGLLAGSLSCQAAISDAEAVNRAGMQRMLSQRIAKNYLMIGTDTRVDLAASQLDSSIASLEENAQLLGDYAPSDGIRKALDETTQTAPVPPAGVEPSGPRAVGRAAAPPSASSLRAMLWFRKSSATAATTRRARQPQRTPAHAQSTHRHALPAMSWKLPEQRLREDFDAAVAEFERGRRS